VVVVDLLRLIRAASIFFELPLIVKGASRLGAHGIVATAALSNAAAGALRLVLFGHSARFVWSAGFFTHRGALEAVAVVAVLAFAAERAERVHAGGLAVALRRGQFALVDIDAGTENVFLEAGMALAQIIAVNQILAESVLSAVDLTV